MDERALRYKNGARRPSLQLVWDRGRSVPCNHSADISQEMVTFARELLGESETGQALGIVCAIIGPGGRHRISVMGDARMNPTLARGIVARLDDVLAKAY